MGHTGSVLAQRRFYQSDTGRSKVGLVLRIDVRNGYPLDSTGYKMLWLVLGFAANHRSICGWVNLSGLLKQSKEQFATRTRRSTIESKRELVEVIVKVLSTHGTLMRAKQPSFQQRCNTVYARHKFARGICKRRSENVALGGNRRAG